MDYLFYGDVTAVKRANTTTVSLHINCEPDETLDLYKLSPDASHKLAYSVLPADRHADHIAAQFEVQNDQLFLFVVAGQSNESDIPFEVAYAVYNGEIVNLAENNVVELVGSIYIFPDGIRKIQS